MFGPLQSCRSSFTLSPSLSLFLHRHASPLSVCALQFSKSMHSSSCPSFSASSNSSSALLCSSFSPFSRLASSSPSSVSSSVSSSSSLRSRSSCSCSPFSGRGRSGSSPNAVSAACASLSPASPSVVASRFSLRGMSSEPAEKSRKSSNSDTWLEVERARPRVPNAFDGTYSWPAGAPNPLDIHRESFQAFMHGKTERFSTELKVFLYGWGMLFFVVGLTYTTMKLMTPDDFEWVEAERERMEQAKRKKANAEAAALAAARGRAGEE
ncbi:hypothetical protein TGME49_224340 [Toxoplasma gondii ME49]|uniref:Transmembrane protein n=3 Tax=Toxoplasma gondii TaxID=5811 RepID=S8GET1_TOXGM|nr:hypothetical protein TGME49_224340 [Toxoplasma gondii ME49]EPT26944.1 hypothetical protein TGME49_224340 [Toxoplasma gondii ME49]KFG45693.1 putative transmembrane protein [Toxoplasma gondii GAB2-2007-GAL-DOM2]KYF42160.1 hypothetical protein TGARI_224340 [Toxoplasma gondii ARI]|eukprot:XP_002366119.1 hypothetical protein TGME49_224340 [Toxoplasma gondii ME49]